MNLFYDSDDDYIFTNTKNSNLPPNSPPDSPPKSPNKPPNKINLPRFPKLPSITPPQLEPVTPRTVNYSLDDYYKELEELERLEQLEEFKRKNRCLNPLCDHKKSSKKPLLNITSIETLQDLIILGKSYHCKNNTHYHGIDLKILFNLVEPLEHLEGLVGMRSVKDNIINQIVFFLQGLNNEDPDKNDMMHTVITGPPGVGKTELGKILGKVYKAMGILSSDKMKIVSRADLVGKYLGHTAKKTQEVIDECKGGIMFIDEAYSLGNKEGRDSFAKECIDTINQNLTERRDFLCIIAGYRDALDDCFFSYNEGLKRRFSFRYNIDAYDHNELKHIFITKVQKEGWGTELDVLINDHHALKKSNKKLSSFFKKNINYFPHFGGDIESLFLNCKIYHGRRVLFLDQNQKKILTMNDIEQGFKTFIKNRNSK